MARYRHGAYLFGVMQTLPERARELVERLLLEPHPEGGWYREILRSPRRVTLVGGNGSRSAVTTIHFLLTRGTHSRWHRVSGEEIWHFEEGGPLELMWLDPGFVMHSRTLGAKGGDAHVEVVPAGCWQSARPLGDYALAGCTMGPGFEFEDFALLANHPDAVEVRRRHPEHAALI